MNARVDAHLILLTLMAAFEIVQGECPLINVDQFQSQIDNLFSVSPKPVNHMNQSKI